LTLRSTVGLWVFSAAVLTLREVRERWMLAVETVGLRLSDGELSEPKRRESSADTGRWWDE
jgi:hypothetical protein